MNEISKSIDNLIFSLKEYYEIYHPLEDIIGNKIAKKMIKDFNQSLSIFKDMTESEEAERAKKENEINKLFSEVDSLLDVFQDELTISIESEGIKETFRLSYIWKDFKSNQSVIVNELKYQGVHGVVRIISDKLNPYKYQSEKEVFVALNNRIDLFETELGLRTSTPGKLDYIKNIILLSENIYRILKKSDALTQLRGLKSMYSMAGFQGDFDNQIRFFRQKVLPEIKGYILDNIRDIQDVNLVLEKNQEFDALSWLQSIISSANRSIKITDPYISLKTLEILGRYNSQPIEIKIVSEKVNSLTSLNVQAFNNQFSKQLEIKIAPIKTIHDRSIIIDDSIVYSVGHSLKDLGTRQALATNITSIEQKNLIISQFETNWRSFPVLT